MAHNERTSDEIASLAAELMRHPDRRVRRLAASTLTQTPDKHPYLQAEARAILAELYSLPTPSLARYAHPENAMARPSLANFMRYYGGDR